MRLLAALCVLGLTASTAAAAEPAPPAAASLAARLSDAATAMEYWDVTAWLDSGERFFGRFLVTNQGPGVRTAATVGHLVGSDGTAVPFKWGRRRDAWTLGPGGGSLKIAKATLELGPSSVVVTIDSAKHGLELRLEIARGTPLVATRPLDADFGLDVAMPAPARGELRTSGMAATRTVVGSGAVTHTWTERTESELVRHRLELLARDGDTAVYLCALTLPDGTLRNVALVSRPDGQLVSANDVAVRFADAVLGGDLRYPVAREWHAQSAALTAHVTVGTEVLRTNPLDLLPQPFRALVALGGRPQRVWADATVALDLASEPKTRLGVSGLIAATFRRAP